jgi:hypothetical protein
MRPNGILHMEHAMKFMIPYTVLGLAIVAGAPVANAQTVITREIVDQPVETVIARQPLVTAPAVVQPAQTVQTTETIRTVQPASRSARRQVVTTQTITRQRVVPAPTVVVRAGSPAQPLYDEVMPGTTIPGSDGDYLPPLYDTVAPVVPPAPAITTSVVQDQYTSPIIYRYIYEPDRILVVDPTTGIAVQAIPR